MISPDLNPGHAPESSPHIELQSATITRIKELLEPLITGHLEEIFEKVGALVIARCKESQFDIREIWVGAHDIGIHRGIFIQVKIGIPDCFKYDSDREDFISDLEIELANAFNDIDFSEVHIVSSPYSQPEHAPILERFKNPELWRKVYEVTK